MKNLLLISLIGAIVFLSSCKKEPEACFTYEPIAALVNEPVNFTDCSENADDYTWDFGDGETGTGANPSHIYIVPGTYTITLNVESKGGTNTSTKQITVTGNNPNLQDCDQYNYGWVRVSNGHDSNYRIYINGVNKGTISGYGTSASFQYNTGTSIHVYALQLDGYLLYPSEFDSYGTISECQTITVNYFKPTLNE